MNAVYDEIEEECDGRDESICLYLPARCALVKQTRLMPCMSVQHVCACLCMSVSCLYVDLLFADLEHK